MTPTPGWHDLTLADYLEVDAMSSSGLHALRRSPAHYVYERANRKETDAMRFGTALHTAVLEPGKFVRYTVLDGCVETLKSGKPCSYAAKVIRGGDGYCGRHDPEKGSPSEPALSPDDFDRVHDIESAIRAHSLADGLLKAHTGTVESTGIFEDPETGVLCRIRPDRIVTANGKVILVDLKTCRDAGPRFWRTIADRGYCHQSALYRRGLAALGTHCDASVIVAVESEPPHGIGCFLLDEDDLARAHQDITRLLTDYRGCLESNRWPTYNIELHEGRLPDWAFVNERD